MWLLRAAVACLSVEQAQATLQPVCKDLVARLERPKTLTHPSLGALIQTISSIGQLRPDIFAQHADSFTSFVMDTILPASLASLGRSKHVKGAPASEGALLKAFAVKVRHVVQNAASC